MTYWCNRCQAMHTEGRPCPVPASIDRQKQWATDANTPGDWAQSARIFFDVWCESARGVESARSSIGIPEPLGRNIIMANIKRRHGQKAAGLAGAYFDKLMFDTTKHSSGERT